MSKKFDPSRPNPTDLVNEWRELDQKRKQLGHAGNPEDEDDYNDLIRQQRKIEFRLSHMLAYKVNFAWNWKRGEDQ